MERENVGANFLLGPFMAESLMMAEQEVELGIAN